MVALCQTIQNLDMVVILGNLPGILSGLLLPQQKQQSLAINVVPKGHGHGQSNGLPELYGRMVFLTAFLFGFIIWNAYSGKLTALLAAHRETLPFTNLEEMLHRTHYSLAVPSETLYMDLLICGLV